MDFRQGSQRTFAKNVRPARFGTQGRAKSAKTAIKSQRTAMQAAKRVANVNQRRNAGYVDLAAAAYPMDNAGAAASIALIATIAQGAAVTQRIGKKAAYKSLQMRGYIGQGSTATVNDVALLIVYDKEPTGILPAITDILNTATAQSFLNDTNSDRFRILRRFNHTLTGNLATPATGNEIQDLDEYIDLKGLPVQFKAAATGAIGDIAVGALYVVTVGSQPPGTTAASAQVGFRTRFMDVEG